MEEVFDICDSSAKAERDDLFRGAGVVRRDDDVGEREQRIGRRNRLLVKDVESRTGEAATRKRVDERFLIDERAARRIDQKCRRFQEREPLSRQQTRRFRTETQMHTHEIGLPE